MHRSPDLPRRLVSVPSFVVGQLAGALLAATVGGVLFRDPR
ncbi:MAG TPA: hypothetical protein VGB49_03645 [Caulobacteraceae bacterium]|jgi:hypothetical protein